MNKLRLGMIGLGSFGRHILTTAIAGPLGTPLFDVITLCDVNQVAAEQVAATLPARPEVASSVDALLADNRIEAIALFTGPNGRADLISRCIRAGKHVITTKPFERDSAAAEQVLTQARLLGRVVHLNSPSPVAPGCIRQMQQWHAEFNLGRPVAARGEIWASYREQPDGSWYDDADQCPVAPLFRLGIYLINDLIRLFGRVESVQVTSSRLFTARPTPDNAQLLLTFKSGALASVFASFCINDLQWWQSGLTVNYENGTIYRNVGPTHGTDPRFHPELELVTRDPANPKSKLTRAATAETCNEDYHWQYFFDACRGQRRADEIEPWQVAEGIRVIEAMRRAELTGARVIV